MDLWASIWWQMVRSMLVKLIRRRTCLSLFRQDTIFRPASHAGPWRFSRTHSIRTAMICQSFNHTHHLLSSWSNTAQLNPWEGSHQLWDFYICLINKRSSHKLSSSSRSLLGILLTSWCAFTMFTWITTELTNVILSQSSVKANFNFWLPFEFFQNCGSMHVWLICCINMLGVKQVKQQAPLHRDSSNPPIWRCQ